MIVLFDFFVQFFVHRQHGFCEVLAHYSVQNLLLQTTVRLSVIPQQAVSVFPVAALGQKLSYVPCLCLC